MRIVSCALLLTILAAPADAARREPTVPARFQGEWNRVRSQCHTALDDSRLHIGAHSIRYYESAGPVRAVVSHGSHEIALISELSGEGERWLDVAYFRLSPDGRTLRDIRNETSPLIRYRCPPARRR